MTKITIILYKSGIIKSTILPRYGGKMKINFLKKIVLSAFLLLLCGSLYAVPQKLGMIKPVRFGNFKSMLQKDNFVILISTYGDLNVYSVENDNFVLEKSYRLNLHLSNPVPTLVSYSNYLYVHCKGKIMIFDISSLPEVRFVNQYLLDGDFRYPYSLAIKGDTLFVGGGQMSAVLLLSLENPEEPTEISRVEGDYLYGTYSIFIYRDILVSSTMLKGITLWDISDKENPVLLRKFDFPKLYCTFVSDNGFLIANNNLDTYIIDIRDKNNIGEPYDTGENLNFGGGFNLGNNIVLLSGSAFVFINKSELSTPDTIEWNQADTYFYCVSYFIKHIQGSSYKLYATNDISNKAIFNIDDSSSNITIIGNASIEDFNNRGDIVLIDNYLYTTYYTKGIAIYRIDNQDIPQFLKYDKVSNSIVSTRGIKLIYIPEGNSQKPYLIAYDGTYFDIIDITDRENPSLVSKVPINTDTFAFDYPYLYAYSLYGSFSIVDLSDIHNPQTMSTLSLPDRPEVSIHYYNNHIYIGNYIIDVSDKNNPSIVKDDFNATYLTGKDNLLMVWEGLNSSIIKVYDLTQPENPEEIQKILLTTEEGNFKINSPTALFFKGNRLFCSYSLNFTRFPRTTVFSLQGQSLVPEYIVDGLVTGFEQRGNYFYIAQEQGTPLGIFGKSYIIPHIATTWGWETKLIADNYGESDTNFTYILKNNINIEQEEITIGAGKQMAIDLSEGQSGEVIVPFNSKVSFKVSYHHTNEHGIAEFLLDSHITRNPILFTPQYLSDHLTWMGVAVSNCEGANGETTLTALNSNGGNLEEKYIFIDPMTRFASVLTNLFTGTDFIDISAVKVQSNTYLSGITISGKGNSQLLFTPATYSKSRTDTRYIPHIDVKGYWDTYLILDNPTDSDITVNLTLYSNGNVAINENKTVGAHSSLPVLINDYNNSEIDCGKITNCTSDLIVRLAYMFKSTGATAEFLIDGDKLSSWLVFNLPAYRSNVLTWWGIAIMNPENNAKDITLKAYSNGQEIDSATIHLEGHTKMADLIENIFQNLNGQTVERVIAQTPSGYISGLNICGSNQDRYLFTPAIPY